MKKLLVICDSNSLYSGRLADYFIHTIKTDYDVRTYSSVDLMANTLMGKTVEILVVDSLVLKQIIESTFRQTVSCKEIVLLSEDDVPHELRDNCNMVIRKYQSAENIYSQVADAKVYSQRRDNNTEQEKNQKLNVKKLVQKKLIRLGDLNDNETLKLIDECIEQSGQIIDENEKRILRNSVFYSIRGLDVLEELASDESITEIMVNGENSIFYEKGGRLIDSKKCFDSREQLLDIIQKIVSGANRIVNMSSPIVDARLSDGSRVNVVLEPVSLDGPILTIRRFPTDPLTAEKLILMGAVSEEIILFLRKLVYAGYNILISGGTGSGKTTFLNILSSFIPKDERVITIEDSAELKIMGIDNLVRLESRNANTEGCKEISIRDLIKSALRMRPDRVVVGEVRGDEAIDMIQAFSVGADGSMSTIHSNSAEDALYRLEMLMMLGGIDMPVSALRRQITIGVDIIIQLGRLKDKSRKLLEIREVTGYEDGNIITTLLYSYEAGEFIKHNDLKRTYKLEKSSWT